MASAIRLTKAERTVLREALEDWTSVVLTEVATKDKKIVEGILTKLDLSELGLKKKSTGLAVPKAVEAFRGVLGARLIVPPTPGPSWWAQMSRKLADYGLTEGDCRTVAKVAAAQWQGPIRAESLIRQADRLLSMSQQELPIAAKHPKAGIDMEDL